MRAALLFALMAFGAYAQSPQFTWQGDVDGIIAIRVHGVKAEVEYRQGAPVQRSEFHFVSPLPANRQNVRLEVRESRGSVSILEQPGLDNDYTTTVLIEDRQDGSSHYSIELYWTPDRSGHIDRMAWSGRVDRETTVSCRARQCESEAFGVKFKFNKPMPSRDVEVLLDETDGRADFRIVEQPSSRNGYTVRIRIVPLLGGSAQCSFVASWPR